MDYATLWRGCWVHLPEMGSLGYSGLWHAIVAVSTGVSVGWFLKVVRFGLLEGWLKVES